MLIALAFALASTVDPTTTPVSSPASSPASPLCAAATAIVSHPSLSDADRARALSTLLDEAMPHVVARASARAASAGELDAALPALAHAVSLACPSRSVDDVVDDVVEDSVSARARAESVVVFENSVSARVRAEAIHSRAISPATRAEGDLLDVFVARARAWLVRFLESAGMQRFAGVSRVVYLALVAFVAAALAVRLLVERRRRARAPAVVARAAPIASARAPRTPDALLVEAERALDARDLRRAHARVEEALAALCTRDPARAESETFDALLARVSERERSALAPLVRAVARARYAAATTTEDARAHGARGLVAACRALVAGGAR